MNKDGKSEDAEDMIFDKHNRKTINIRKSIKRSAVLVAVTLFLYSCSPSEPPVTSYDDFNYRIIDNNTAVEITGFRRMLGGYAQIPSHIRGLPVTRIVQYALGENPASRGGAPGFHAVKIPDTVTYIAYGAFRRNRISTLTLGSGVRYIGRNAFSTNRIDSIVIPSSVVFVSGFNANRLTSLHIPYGVQYIGDWAFRMNQLTSVSIPDSVQSIGPQAFRRNRLTEVSIPQHTMVADNAFDRRVTITRR